METLLRTFVFFDLLLIGLSLPLLYRKIKRNPWYGFRFPSVFRSEEVWLEVNRFGAKWMLATAAVFLLAAIGLYFIPNITLDGYSLTCLAVFAVGMTVTIIQTLRYNRALN